MNHHTGRGWAYKQAVWPTPNLAANDNVASIQLQGHAGTIIECTTCHAAGSLGLTLDGPHGIHRVSDENWNLEHEELAEHNEAQCRTCHGHGQNGEGTVLSRAAADRNYLEDEHGTDTVFVAKGTPVGCGLCHENPL